MININRTHMYSAKEPINPCYSSNLKCVQINNSEETKIDKNTSERLTPVCKKTIRVIIFVFAPTKMRKKHFPRNVRNLGSFNGTISKSKAHILAEIKSIIPEFLTMPDFGAIPRINPNEEAARQFLTSRKWPAGFQTLLLNQLTEKVPIRFFICDDSGSMAENDGTRLAISGNIHKAVNSSR